MDVDVVCLQITNYSDGHKLKLPETISQRRSTLIDCPHWYKDHIILFVCLRLCVCVAVHCVCFNFEHRVPQVTSWKIVRTFVSSFTFTQHNNQFQMENVFTVDGLFIYSFFFQLSPLLFQFKSPRVECRGEKRSRRNNRKNKKSRKQSVQVRRITQWIERKQ